MSLPSRPLPGRPLPGASFSESLLPGPAGWHRLPEPAQLEITTAALHAAFDIAAGQAETLAEELAAGGLPDRGGADALRLLAAVLRIATGPRQMLPSLEGLRIAGCA